LHCGRLVGPAIPREHRGSPPGSVAAGTQFIPRAPHALSQERPRRSNAAGDVAAGVAWLGQPVEDGPPMIMAGHTRQSSSVTPIRAGARIRNGPDDHHNFIEELRTTRRELSERGEDWRQARAARACLPPVRGLALRLARTWAGRSIRSARTKRGCSMVDRDPTLPRWTQRAGLL